MVFHLTDFHALSLLHFLPLRSAPAFSIPAFSAPPTVRLDTDDFTSRNLSGKFCKAALLVLYFVSQSASCLHEKISIHHMIEDTNQKLALCKYFTYLLE